MASPEVSRESQPAWLCDAAAGGSASREGRLESLAEGSRAANGQQVWPEMGGWAVLASHVTHSPSTPVTASRCSTAEYQQPREPADPPPRERPFQVRRSSGPRSWCDLAIAGVRLSTSCRVISRNM